MLCMVCGFSFAQRTITGTVVDDKQEPLIGANILIKGQATGTVTDFDGKYSIDVRGDESTILVFSYTGFSPKEVAIGTLNVIDVELSGVTVLDEVLVIGYGTDSRKLTTQSVGQVTERNVNNIVSLSPQQILQGQVAGVQMTNSSGVLGAASSVRVRGVASLNAGGSPLYVVDGVPLNDGSNASNYGGTGLNGIVDINQNDIESISVLKDAAAAAIYGSRGANGVILITTKKGKEGTDDIEFNFTYGSLEATDTYDMANTAEFAEIRNQDISDLPSDNYFDWPSAVLQTGKTYDANIGFRGGSARTNYFIGGGYTEQSNYSIGNDLSKISARLNFQHEVNDRVSIGTNMGLSLTNSDRTSVENSTFAPLTSAYLQAPWVDAYNEDGTFANTGFIANVIAIEELGLVDFNSYRAVGNVFGTLDITEDLTFKTDWGLDFREVQEEFREVNAFTPGGYAFNDQDRDLKWLTTNTLNYTSFLTPVHYLGVTLGQSYEQSQFSDLTVEGTGFASDLLRNVASASTPTTTSATRTAWSLASYFGRVNYRYNDRYLFEASYRRDGSSRFGADNRYGNFWAVSAGWIVTEEKWFQPNNVLSFLKINTSYGISGNDRIGNFASRGLAAGGNDYAGSPGFAATQAENPDLKWEETSQFEVGFEAQLFDKIDVDVAFYNKTTTDLLLNFPLPESSGLSSITRNAGEMKNTGVDIDISANVIQKQDVSLSLNFNVGFLNNEITSLPGASEDPFGNPFIAGSASQRAVQGMSANEFYLIRYSGINPQTGDAEWLDGDGNPTTTPTANDRVYVGSAIPDFTGGFGANLNVKNFDLGILVNFVSGSFVNLGELRFTENPVSGFNKSTTLLDYWQNPGDQAFAPALTSDTRGTFAQRSTNQLFDGSYARLKNVTLGYTFRGSDLNSSAFKNIRVFARGINLLTLDSDEFRGQDIEVSANGQSNLVQGESFFAMPQSRIFQFGVQAKF